MRFGTKQYGSSFDRLFYIYSDGAVVDLTDGLIPSTVSLPVGAAGYPAVTSHQFSFSFDVPLPQLGFREYHLGQFNSLERLWLPLMTGWPGNCQTLKDQSSRVGLEWTLKR